MSKPIRLPSAISDQTYFITLGTDGRDLLLPAYLPQRLKPRTKEAALNGMAKAGVLP